MTPFSSLRARFTVAPALVVLAVLASCAPASGAVAHIGAGADGSFTRSGRVDTAVPPARLLVQRRPERRAYLRFDLPRRAGTVIRARLMLYAWSPGSALSVHTLRSDGPWGERAVPRRTTLRLGASVATVQAIRRRTWVAVDVTRAARNAGRLDIALTTAGARPVRFGSRETRMAPRLEVLTTDATDVRDPTEVSGAAVTDTAAATSPGMSPPAVGPSLPPAVLPPSDTRPPSAPASLSVLRATVSGLDLAWPAASDDVGVTGYRYYVDGGYAGTTSGTAATVGGLACGVTYEVSVDAEDAVGNRSARRTTLGSTRPCPPAPASVFVAPGGDDRGPCTRQEPCATLDRGHRAASPGQVVELAGGEYPGQRMTDGSRGGEAAVTFRPAPGETVVLAELEIEDAAAVTIQDLTIAGTIWVNNPDPDIVGSRDITFESVRATTFRFAGRLQRITVRGGVYGGAVDDQPQIKKYDFGAPDAASPRDVLIDGVTFRDFRASGRGVHTECLQLLHGSVITVRNSRFDRCDGTGAIGVTDGPVDRLTLENNFLGRAGNAYFAIQLTKNSSNVVVRNNSMSKGMIFSDQETGGPWTFEGNYMPFHASLCTAGATHVRNVYAGGACSATDLAVDALEFVDVDAFDLHLAPGSAAIDRGSPASFPPADIDGDARPMGAGPDAGADEAG